MAPNMAPLPDLPPAPVSSMDQPPNLQFEMELQFVSPPHPKPPTEAQLSEYSTAIRRDLLTDATHIYLAEKLQHAGLPAACMIESPAADPSKHLLRLRAPLDCMIGDLHVMDASLSIRWPRTMCVGTG